MDDARRPEHDRQRYAFGIFLLLIVVLLWTGSNFVTQDIFDEGFNKPFLVTYLNTASFAVYLIPFAFKRVRRSLHTPSTTVYAPIARDELDEDSAFVDRLSPPDVQLSSSAMGLPPLTHRETFDLSCTFVVIWILANWTVSASLRYTTVASATILASTSGELRKDTRTSLGLICIPTGFFTLIIGTMFRVETLSIVRVLAVVGSFVGVVLVSQSDYSSEPLPPSSPTPSSLLRIPSSAPLLGDFLALASAFFYGLYVTLLKVRVRSESRMDMRLFFGFVGAISICTTWVVGVLLHVTGIEEFAWPTGRRQWVGVLLNMLITLSSDYLYVLAMLKTTPLMVTVGLTLTIPCALLGDAFLGTYASLQVVGGAMLVILAFFAIGLEDTGSEWLRKLSIVIGGRKNADVRRSANVDHAEIVETQ